MFVFFVVRFSIEFHVFRPCCRVINGLICWTWIVIEKAPDFCTNIKDGVLHPKRCPFTTQNTVFYKLICGLL